MAKKKDQGEVIDLGSIEARIKKQYGNIAASADLLKETQGKIIPTTLGLDIGLSGGIMEGSITNIGGRPKAGKTSLVLQIIRNAQRMGKKCFYMDVEHRLTDELLSCISGLDKSQLIIIRSNEDKILAAEDYLNILIQLLTTEKGCLVILDSLAALCTSELLGSSIGDTKKMMAIPSMLYETLRKVAGIVSVNKSTLITITHIQKSPSMYTPVVEYGGEAIQYFASNRLTCLASPEVEENGVKVGKDSVFDIRSSAIGPPGAKVTIPIRYGRGVDEYEDLVSIGQEMGIFDLAGSWFNFKYKEEDKKIQGKAKLIEFLKADPEFFQQVEKDLRKLVFGSNEILTISQ